MPIPTTVLCRIAHVQRYGRARNSDTRAKTISPRPKASTVALLISQIPSKMRVRLHALDLVIQVTFGGNLERIERYVRSCKSCWGNHRADNCQSKRQSILWQYSSPQEARLWAARTKVWSWRLCWGGRRLWALGRRHIWVISGFIKKLSRSICVLKAVLRKHQPPDADLNSRKYHHNTECPFPALVKTSHEGNIKPFSDGEREPYRSLY